MREPLCPAEWFPGPQLHVAVGDEESEELCRELGIEHRFGTAAAITYTRDGTLAVVFSSAAMERPAAEIAALAAHESYHCAETWLEIMGEREPASEETAYMVQCCFIDIWKALEGALAARAAS